MIWFTQVLGIDISGYHIQVELYHITVMAVYFTGSNGSFWHELIPYRSAKFSSRYGTGYFTVCTAVLWLKYMNRIMERL